MEKLAKKSKFSIDGGTAYSGYTFGQTWNGWSCPSFELSEALKIAEEASLSNDYKLEFDKYHNCFVEYYSNNENCVDEQPEIFRAVTINTVDGPKDVYSIGAFGWVWDNESDFNS